MFVSMFVVSSGNNKDRVNCGTSWVVLPCIMVGTLWVYVSNRLIAQFDPAPAKLTFWFTVTSMGFLAGISLWLGMRWNQLFKRLSTAQKPSQERICEPAALLDQTQDAILVLDLHRCITYCNLSARRFYRQNCPDLVGHTADAVLFPDDPQYCAQLCRHTLEQGSWSGEIHETAGSAKHRWVQSRWTRVRDSADQPVGFLVTNTDITEKRRLEIQFLHAQRMESLGTLASGVAHDLNNILSPILIATEVLRSRAAGPEDESLLGMLRDGARRGADIVKQLLIFGRGLDVRRSELQVRSLLKEMAKVIKETFPRNITLERLFPQDLWTICADPTQIHQVLLNLCVNARDAMPRGGRLTLAAENVVLDASACDPETEAGPYVLIKVTDTGAGIRPEIIERIFDPFFTTKEPGKGTGLGLSTVLGIVKSHRGFVRVQSEVGRGSQFRIYLPAIARHQTSEPAQSLAVPPRGNGQFILLVDDDDSILKAGQRMLEENGYRLLTASNGAEGIVTFSRQRTEIQAVVTDVVMPIMDGPALIRGLRQLSPDVRIIVMSGLPEQEDLLKSGVQFDDFLSKPFEASQLLVTLHRAIQARGNGARRRTF